MSGVSSIETPWAVLCKRDGRVYLTRDEYTRQLHLADERWYCPLCGKVGRFDDDTYDRASFGHN